MAASTGKVEMVWIKGSRDLVHKEEDKIASKF